VISISLTAISYISFLLYFNPRIDISVGTPIVPTLPLTAEFLLTNSGNTRLDGIQIGIDLCYLGPMQDGTCRFSDDATGDTLIIIPAWARPSLRIGEHYSVSPYDALHLTAAVGRVDVALVAIFHVWPLPHEFRRPFRFRAQPGADGLVRWRPDALGGAR
jgi:hypothetical protein